jgi:outer membrane receptor for Fe3+-dicitrate
VLLQYGFGFRTDETKGSELSRTANRKTTLEKLQLGDVDQSNYFGYFNGEIEFGKLKINPALRIDHFKFNYEDKLQTVFETKTESKTKFSPKLNFIYTQSNQVQFFIKSGFGFHSNDTRVVVAKLGKEILPTSFGADFGTTFKATPRLIVNTALWFLNLQQEFVYVGDAGIVEPSGRSRRIGADLGIRYQLNDYLFLDADANYTRARSIDEPKGQDYIPLAPAFTTTGGLSFTNYKGFSGGINYRYLKSRPANEDNSIVAEGYFVSDLNLNYETKQYVFGLAVQNIFNTEWNETQFATESRLQNETASVEEIHFTPGTPFFLKGKITYKF